MTSKLGNIQNGLNRESHLGADPLHRLEQAKPVAFGLRNEAEQFY